MSPTNQMNTHPANLAPSTYSPVESVVSHDYAGVQKNRKQASTGGGRAWSEDEEVYLLQTRLQKMPYKHIASHLKKTELACRLHYHQLSHGSGNRRKRTSSVSPSTSSTQHSPVMHTMPSPVNQHVPIAVGTPPAYAPQSPQHIQLPSLTQGGSPPRLQNHPIAILPKPSPPRRAISDSTLRLDTTSSAQSIDTARLRAIYEAHRASFWSQIAAEYGCGASPFALEESWKSCIVSNAPPTPDSAYAKMAPVQEPKKDATSISALLGIDASPRSPKEREMIRRMEERRGSMVMPRDILMAGVESA